MSSTPPSKTKNTPLSDFGWNLNQTLYQLIGFADTKAAALIAAAVAIFALLLSNKPTLSLITILYAFALIFLAICALCACFAFFPFTIGENNRITAFWRWMSQGGNNQNAVFWQGIQRQQLGSYQELVRTLDDSKVNDDYAEENHRLSKELKYRFGLIQLSIAFLMAGLVFAALYVLLRS